MMPQKLFYSEKPYTQLHKGGLKPQEITAEFIRKLCPTLTWMESFKGSDINPSTLKPLVLSFINEKVGHGVFATRNYKDGDIICLYTGERISVSDKSRARSPYLMACPEVGIMEMSGDDLITLGGDIQPATHGIDAEKVGNIGRFVNYMPSREKLQYLKFTSNQIKAQAATSNARFGVVRDDGVVVAYITATQDIAAGQQIGIDYGDDYLIRAADRFGCEMQLFNRDTGDIISAKDYEYVGPIRVIITDVSGRVRSCSLDRSKFEQLAKHPKPFAIGAGGKDNFVVTADTLKQALAVLPPGAKTLHLQGQDIAQFFDNAKTSAKTAKDHFELTKNLTLTPEQRYNAFSAAGEAYKAAIKHLKGMERYVEMPAQSKRDCIIYYLNLTACYTGTKDFHNASTTAQQALALCQQLYNDDANIYQIKARQEVAKAAEAMAQELVDMGQMFKVI